MPYLKKAIKSAIDLPQTKEVILVDDGSTDGSYEYAHQKASQSQGKIKLFIHHQHKNKGISASRNLGIRMSKSPFIAFLDADDYYLPHRFQYCLPYFQQYPDCMATAESIEVDHLQDAQKLSTTKIPKIYHPAELFKIYALSRHLHFSLDGITIRKSFMDPIGLFDETLSRSEDTDFVYRLALSEKLHIPQADHIVAKYRRNNINPLRNDQNIRANKRLFHNKWFKLMLKNNWDKKINRALVKMYIYYNIPYPKSENRLSRYWETLKLIVWHPVLLKKMM